MPRALSSLALPSLAFPLLALPLLSFSLALMACDDDTDPATDPVDAAPPAPDAAPITERDCQLNRTTWQSTIRPLVVSWCGQCHGSTPMLGAPYTLTTLDRLYRVADGTLLIDRFVAELRAGTMPPPAQPQPDAASRAAMLAWATCGDDDTPPDGPNPGGFDVNRPILAAPAEPPAGTDFFELRAHDFEMPPDEGDRYQCFTFAAPIDAPRSIRRIETLVDDARVVHHVVLIPGGEGRAPGEHGPCADDNPLSLIYAWAPGQGPLHFADGGMHLAPGERLTLQIHYNNAAGHADVRDASGVRVYHGPIEPEAPVIDMIAFGPLNFEVPPRSTAEAVGYCVLPQDVTLLASFPHMHETGIAFEQVILRVDGTEESLIRLDGWDFNSQYIYETPIELKAGDTVITRCRFQNLGETWVNSGTKTAEEMCFNFAYATPPLPGRYCNRSAPRQPRPYTPGECAPVDATDAGLIRVAGHIAEGPPPIVTGGPRPRGHYRLDGYTVVFGSYNIGVATIDPQSSQTSAVGQAWFEDDRILVDLLLEVHLTDGVIAVEQDLPISVVADLLSLDELTGEAAVTLQCGAQGESTVGYETSPDGRLRLTLAPRELGVPVVFDLALVPMGP